MIQRTTPRLSLFALLLAAPLGAQGLPDPAPFDRVLERYLRDGLVDYAGLKAGRADLDAYVEALGRTDSATLAAASRDARLAFWINAYNACALRLVIDHYPIERRGFVAGLVNDLAGIPANSIRQIPDTWSREFCPVAGRDRSLDEIEHEIIRPMGDPRIHFAVNCASRSCPELAPRAYVADSLDGQLDAAVRRFVDDPHHYRLEDGARPVLHLNKVLEWYAEDFGGRDGVVQFLLPYLPPDDARVVRQAERVSVTFVDYDWTLNDTAVFGTEE